MEKSQFLEFDFWESSEPRVFLNPRLPNDDLRLLQSVQSHPKWTQGLGLQSSGTESSRASEKKLVQTFGRKKNATAVASCTEGNGFIKVNGKALNLMEPEPLRIKVFEPILLVGGNRFKDLNIRVRVKGGGQSNQIYAVRQAIAKALLAFY